MAIEFKDFKIQAFQNSVLIGEIAMNDDDTLVFLPEANRTLDVFEIEEIKEKLDELESALN